MNPTNDRHRLIRLAGMAVIVGLLVVALVVFAVSNNSAKTADKPAPAPAAAGTTTETTSTAASTYRNGTYRDTGAYRSPGGSQKVNVELILVGDVVSGVVVTEAAVDDQSSEFQEMFIGGIKAQVVGKPLDEVDVSRGSGASLTSKGFNDALDKIKAQAKA